MSKPHNFSHHEIELDRYIRSGILSSRSDAYTLEPTRLFTENVITSVQKIEKQKNVKLTVLFAFITLAPFSIREIWFLVRHNYFSVSEFPLSGIITDVYKLFLTSAATYVFIGGGFLLALYIVGLPKWRVPYLQRLSKN